MINNKITNNYRNLLRLYEERWGGKLLSIPNEEMPFAYSEMNDFIENRSIKQNKNGSEINGNSAMFPAKMQHNLSASEFIYDTHSPKATANEHIKLIVKPRQTLLVVPEDSELFASETLPPIRCRSSCCVCGKPWKYTSTDGKSLCSYLIFFLGYKKAKLNTHLFLFFLFG